MTIQSFLDNGTKTFFVTGMIKKGIGWAAVARIAKRKLDILHYASVLDDLRAPPGNRLESLKGSLKGFHSIRINDQWRIIFKWSEAGPEDVCITDYH